MSNQNKRVRDKGIGLEENKYFDKPNIKEKRIRIYVGTILTGSN